MQVLPISAAEARERSRWAFVVGAPRCGTTSLSRYLERHPDVCFSDVKETHYFAATDLRGLPDHELRETVQREYVDRNFRGGDPSALHAEGSVTYLYVPEQVEPILRLWPDAKFIIGVRNPLEMVPSLHQRLCYIGDETELDFETAWNLVPERREGRSVPRRCVSARWLDYWGAGQLGMYLDQFLTRFGRERSFVYVYDDLASDPRRVYLETLDFLGLPDDGQQDFAIHRDSSGFKVQWVQRLMTRPPGMMMLLGSKTYRRHAFSRPQGEPGALADALWAVRQRILAWNKAPAPPVTISPKLRSDMVAMFRDDVAHLGQLLGRDFSHWLEEPAPAEVGERQGEVVPPRRSPARLTASPPKAAEASV